jgi:gliding motility-associated lipoprotein GldD
MKKVFYFICFSFFILVSCKRNFQPKPRGYFKIDLPEHDYKMFDSAGCPFTFKIPVYSEMQPDKDANAEQWWMNLVFPTLGATLHLSYKPIRNDSTLYNAIEDCHKLTYKHISRAEDIIENDITNSNGASGMVYELNGETATGMNFYVTDSTHHFLRGALYFNAKTVPDSLAPSLKFVKQDVNILIGSLRWRN